MLTMDQIHRIRQLYYEQGLTNLWQRVFVLGKEQKDYPHRIAKRIVFPYSTT